MKGVRSLSFKTPSWEESFNVEIAPFFLHAVKKLENLASTSVKIRDSGAVEVYFYKVRHNKRHHHVQYKPSCTQSIFYLVLYVLSNV